MEILLNMDYILKYLFLMLVIFQIIDELFGLLCFHASYSWWLYILNICYAFVLITLCLYSIKNKRWAWVACTIFSFSLLIGLLGLTFTIRNWNILEPNRTYQTKFKTYNSFQKFLMSRFIVVSIICFVCYIAVGKTNFYIFAIFNYLSFFHENMRWIADIFSRLNSILSYNPFMESMLKSKYFLDFNDKNRISNPTAFGVIQRVMYYIWTIFLGISIGGLDYLFRKRIEPDS